MAQEAQALINWIHSARIFAEKAGLSNMVYLLERLGHPESGMGFVHVAGTNGKGSVCAMTESALRHCGMKTGLYTSPYLARYNERIRLMGVPIGDEQLVSCGARVRAAADCAAAEGIRPTAFELGTALALTAFREAGVDCAVIETGIGGRLDPTNVISPLVCAIATIGLDHMEVLGDTLPAIAREKAGIIKPGAPVALYPMPDAVDAVFEDAARHHGAALLRAADCPMRGARVDEHGASFGIDVPGLGEMNVRINIPGAHQMENARLALCTLSLLAQRGLPLTPQGVETGIARACWPGRLEWIGEDVLLDGAHNPQGAQALSDYLRAYEPDGVVLLTGMMRDKQPAQCVDILAPRARAVVATQVDWPRALPAGELAAMYAARGVKAHSCPEIAQALLRARQCGRPLVVAGSLYLVGAVRAILEESAANAGQMFP